MSKPIALVVALVLLAALLLFSMTYTVSFDQIAIKTRFGRTTPDSIIRTPGLKFRLPLFADRITTYDTRLQLHESPFETIPTVDEQQVMVKAFLMWRVKTEGDGPLDFFGSYQDVVEANQSLSNQFRTALRTGVSRFGFYDLIGGQNRLAQAEKAVLDEMTVALDKKGIKAEQVGISQLALPAKTTTAVLRRMEAMRTSLSEAERYKGDAEASGITSRAAAQAEKIRTFAAQYAEEIKGAGNEDAKRYMEAMAQDQGLAIFLAWRDALEQSLAAETTVVLPTSFAPFHLLQLNAVTDSQGIPQPSAENGRIAAEKLAPAARDGTKPQPTPAISSPSTPAAPGGE